MTCSRMGTHDAAIVTPDMTKSDVVFEATPLFFLC